MSGVHKSRAPELFYGGTHHLSFFSMQLILCHPSGVQNFEVDFLKLCATLSYVM